MHQNRTEQREHHYSIEPTIQEVDRDVRELSDAQIARLAAQMDLSVVGSRPWENWTTDERRAMRASNEVYRRQHEAKRQAKDAEDQAKIDAREQARLDAQIADYRQRARQGFPGTDAQFAAAWPRMLEDWQISESRRRMDEQYAEVRRRIGGAF